MNQNQFTYPISRILANPIALEYLEQVSEIPLDVLMEAFYDLFETFLLQEEDPEGEGEDTIFLCYSWEDSNEFTLTFDTGESQTMRLSEGGEFTTQEEASSSFEVSALLVKLLKQALPEDWQDDFGLETPPLPKNNWLQSESGDSFEGVVYKLSDPDSRLPFQVKYLGDNRYDVKVGEVN